MVAATLSALDVSRGQLFSRNWAEPQFGGGQQEDETLQITPAPTAFYRIDGLERDSQAAQLARDSGLYQASGNTRQGAHGPGEEDENTEEGRERKAQTSRMRSEAFGGGAWYEHPASNGGFFGGMFDGARNAMSDLQENAPAAAANIGESALHTATFGLAGFFGIRSREQIAEDIRATGEIDGRTERGPTGADRLGNDFNQDAGATISNVGESAFNMITFGMVGRSREQIAAAQAEHGTVDGRAPAEQQPAAPAPAASDEPLIAQSDVVNRPRPDAPDMNGAFAFVSSIDWNPFDGQPAQDRQLASAAPRTAQPGMSLGA